MPPEWYERPEVIAGIVIAVIVVVAIVIYVIRRK
jgi:hypothetical protein